MKMGKRKLGRWMIGMIVLLLVMGGMGITRIEEAPLAEIESTRRMLSEAESVNAEIYSHRSYSEAKALYDSAMVNWQRENRRIIFWRQFDTVKALAAKSGVKSEEAITYARKVQKNTRIELQDEITLLRQEMERFDRLFLSLPLDRKVRDRYTRGKLLLNEAEIAFEKGNYKDGKRKSREAAALLLTSYRTGKELLKDYLQQIPLWQKQWAKVVRESEQKGSYAIVVEKIPAYCYLYYKGVVQDSFPVEFGRNWVGDKRYEGDLATPEGEYRVVKRLSGPMTRYFKALLLDYPNAEDRLNFEKLKQEGKISEKARPGNLIEIHGEGGRGGNWTNGCVALENKDMIRLYRQVGKGTPVLIIGTHKDREKVYSTLHLT